jgi:hypothetical protein
MKIPGVMVRRYAGVVADDELEQHVVIARGGIEGTLEDTKSDAFRRGSVRVAPRYGLAPVLRVEHAERPVETEIAAGILEIEGALHVTAHLHAAQDATRSDSDHQATGEELGDRPVPVGRLVPGRAGELYSVTGPQIRSWIIREPTDIRRHRCHCDPVEVVRERRHGSGLELAVDSTTLGREPERLEGEAFADRGAEYDPALPEDDVVEVVLKNHRTAPELRCKGWQWKRVLPAAVGGAYTLDTKEELGTVHREDHDPGQRLSVQGREPPQRGALLNADVADNVAALDRDGGKDGLDRQLV